jgi:hypothetical protein
VRQEEKLDQELHVGQGELREAEIQKMTEADESRSA